MKKLLSLGFATVLLGSASHAAPFMAIGDGAELFVTGALGVRVDDNIQLTKNKTSDTIWDINPGAELTFGKNAQLKGALTLVDAFANYSDHSKFNTNLFSGDFVTKYDDGKMKLGYNLGYHELNQNTADLRGLVRRDVFSTGGNGEVEISQLTLVGGGVQYTHENYKRKNYADSDDYVVPVNFYYKMTPKMDASVGYQYREHDVNIGEDSTDNFFNVGARGEFSPLLTGTLRAGVTNRHLQKSGNHTTLGLDSSFAYELTPKTSLQAGASYQPDTSPQGLQQKNLTINGRVDSKISDQWSVNGGLSYRGITYTTRTDDYWEATLGARYILNTYVNFVGAYVYRDYTSKISASEFNNNVFSVAANLRY
jgi:polysaccharide biosynthesis protein VpsM